MKPNQINDLIKLHDNVNHRLKNRHMLTTKLTATNPVKIKNDRSFVSSRRGFP